MDLGLMADVQPTLTLQHASSHARPLSLRANFQWTFAGNIVNAAGQYAILIVLAKLGGDLAVGMFATGLSIATPVMAFAMLQLRSVQATDARGEYPFSDYFATRIVWTALGMAVIVGWAIAQGLNRETIWVVSLIGLAKAIDSLSDIVRGIFQRCERMDYSGISMCIRGMTGLMGFAVVQFISRDVVLACAGMAAAYLVSFVLYDMLWARMLLSGEPDPSHRRFRARFDRAAIVQLSWLALPLGVVMGLISLQINIPRLVLLTTDGLQSVGYFTAMVYPMLAGQMIVGALGQSAAPRLAKYYVEDVPAYRRLLRRLVVLAAGLGVALVLGTLALGKPLLALLFTPEYANYHSSFVVLALAAAIQLVSSCWGYALTSARRFRVQVMLVGISCASTLIAALLLVPRLGIMGASLAVLATSVVSLATFLIAMRSALRGRDIPLPLEEAWTSP